MKRLLFLALLSSTILMLHAQTPMWLDETKNEENRMQAVWRKKFGAAPQNPAEKAKQMRFLASRGFATSTIAQWMRNLPVMDDEGLEE